MKRRVEPRDRSRQSGRGPVDAAFKAANALSDKLYPDQPPGFPGERHVLHLDPKSVTGAAPWQRHSYTGPGTNIVERVRRGDKPVDATDAAARAHDLAYAAAEDMADIRRADEAFIAAVSKVPGKTAAIARKMIALKNKHEDFALRFNPLIELQKQKAAQELKRKKEESGDTTVPDTDIAQQEGGFLPALLAMGALARPVLLSIAADLVFKGTRAIAGHFSKKQQGEGIADSIAPPPEHVTRSTLRKMKKQDIKKLIVDTARDRGLDSDQLREVIAGVRARSALK